MLDFRAAVGDLDKLDETMVEKLEDLAFTSSGVRAIPIISNLIMDHGINNLEGAILFRQACHWGEVIGECILRWGYYYGHARENDLHGDPYIRPDCGFLCVDKYSGNLIVVARDMKIHTLLPKESVEAFGTTFLADKINAVTIPAQSGGCSPIAVFLDGIKDPVPTTKKLLVVLKELRDSEEDVAAG